MEITSSTASTQPVSIKRPLMISMALAILLVLFGGYNDALMFAPIGLLVLFCQVLGAVYYSVRRDWRMLKVCGLRALMWIGAMAMLTVIHNYYLNLSKKSAEAVVTALTKYHAREGHYPPKLDALAPRDIAVVPQWGMSPSRDHAFHYRPTGAPGTTDAWGVYEGNAVNYTLRFFSGFRHQHIYDSATGQWKLTD